MQLASLRDTSASRARRLGVCALLVVAAAILLLTTWYFSAAGRQSRGMRAASRHIHTVLNPRLAAADDRFANVSFFVYTGEDGAVGVKGDVATWEDMKLLRELVRDSHPPRPTFWGFLNVAEVADREPPDPALLERVTPVAKQ